MERKVIARNSQPTLHPPDATELRHAAPAPATRSGSRSRRWGTIPRRCIMPARNTRTCPAAVPLCGTKAEVTVRSLDDWEKDWERAENVESGNRKVEMCNQRCCRWISGRRWPPSRNRISAGKRIGVTEILQNKDPFTGQGRHYFQLKTLSWFS